MNVKLLNLTALAKDTMKCSKTGSRMLSVGVSVALKAKKVTLLCV